MGRGGRHADKHGNSAGSKGSKNGKSGKSGKGGGRRGGAGQGRANAEAYLERNAQKPGVVIHESGLQLEVVQAGDGPRPEADSRVTVDQRVRLVDGKVIGDTFRDGHPDTFSLSEAVEGYREGLMQMQVGERCVITCPPELAWGRKGAGNKIPPNAAIIYDVRLRAIR